LDVTDLFIYFNQLQHSHVCLNKKEKQFTYASKYYLSTSMCTLTLVEIGSLWISSVSESKIVANGHSFFNAYYCEYPPPIL
jgi:hypothetical protein